MYQGIDTIATTGTSAAPRAGSNRIVICYLFHLNATGSATVTALTWGGVSGTYIQRLQGGTVGSYSDVEAWYFKESQIPGASAALSWTLSAVAAESRAVLVTFAGVSQTTPLGTTVTNPGSPGDALTSIAPAYSATPGQNLVLGLINQTPAAGISWSSFTEVLDSVITTNARTAVGYVTGTARVSSTETASWAGGSKAAGVLVSMNPAQISTVVPIVQDIVQPVVNSF